MSGASPLPRRTRNANVYRRLRFKRCVLQRTLRYKCSSESLLPTVIAADFADKIIYTTPSQNPGRGYPSHNYKETITPTLFTWSTQNLITSKKVTTIFMLSHGQPSVRSKIIMIMLLIAHNQHLCIIIIANNNYNSVQCNMGMEMLVRTLRYFWTFGTLG